MPRMQFRPGTVRFGAPLDFSRYDGMESRRQFIERAVTDEIMYALMGLSGQENVDIYAASAKAANSAPRRLHLHR